MVVTLNYPQNNQLTSTDYINKNIEYLATGCLSFFMGGVNLFQNAHLSCNCLPNVILFLALQFIIVLGLFIATVLKGMAVKLELEVWEGP